MNSWFNRHGLKLFAIVLLGGALYPFPYVYFQAMNWIVMLAAAQTIWQAYQQKTSWVIWLYGAIAILFNPLAPLYVRKDIWQLADLTAAVLFILAFAAVRRRTSRLK